ncbi:MAG: aspartate-semialdehyde dehydrogenase [bacterium]|nr:aspartate-semialdehyde dehydrogenase [bacterium]
MSSFPDKKIRVGLLGATGTVGQRFAALLERHPWFEVVRLAASERSSGRPFSEAVAGRWSQASPVPAALRDLRVLEVEKDIREIADSVDLVFSAMSLDKERIRKIETDYAAAGVAVVSANSAHRLTEDVPMLMPEVNPGHIGLVDIQRRNRGWATGLIAVKPNCSIQSYVPVLEAWKSFGPERVVVSTYQAISGAGKTFETWPEMRDNVIPLIPGEEKKSEEEPLKIWGTLEAGRLVHAGKPLISATCIRVPVTDGHMASFSVAFRAKPKREELIEAIRSFRDPLLPLGLPSSPKKFLTWFDEDDRPQTRLDRDLENGMGISAGRLREDPILDWKVVALSHNTLRGAAGGAVLIAELLVKKGYVLPR